MGHVTVFPGGGIPGHEHEQAGDFHELHNETNEGVVMMFVYAPKGIVDHWQKEREGRWSTILATF
ncbi:hypothetical protein hamaS1_23720 [Moorella sp. Hama-1]|nr:hypothetical protein hamaS1_23720 [Moorella sp. Hama-1]